MSDSRTCTKCGTGKPLTDFSRKKAGYQPLCKLCSKATNDEYRAKNREALLAAAKQRYAANREALTAKQKAYYVKNAAERLAYAAEWRKRNPERARELYKANAEKQKAAAREWKRSNPEHQRMLEKARRAASKRTPAWADRKLMADSYRYAKIMRAHGVDCHVDHIVPLRGKTVCGLHADDNLTVVLAEVNLRKGAKLLETA